MGHLRIMRATLEKSERKNERKKMSETEMTEIIYRLRVIRLNNGKYLNIQQRVKVSKRQLSICLYYHFFAREIASFVTFELLRIPWSSVVVITDEQKGHVKAHKSLQVL